MMNHQCVPNVRYKFDDRQVMVVEAATRIAKGEEIFTSYLQLLWSTLSRRLLLKATKDFMCFCPRCKDPTENNTYLSALKCAKQECAVGRLLPIDPIAVSSPWQCDACGLKMPFKKISRIRDVLSSVICGKLKNKNFRHIQSFLKTTIPDILPPNNEFALELKLYVIWRVGEEKAEEGDEWDGDFYMRVELKFQIIILEYLLEDFLEKELYCEDLLALLETMGAGESTIKGLLQFELFKTREALKRLSKASVSHFKRFPMISSFDEVILTIILIIIIDLVLSSYVFPNRFKLIPIRLYLHFHPPPHHLIFNTHAQPLSCTQINPNRHPKSRLFIYYIVSLITSSPFSSYFVDLFCPSFECYLMPTPVVLPEKEIIF